MRGQFVEVAADVPVLRFHLDGGVGGFELLDGLVGQLGAAGVAPPGEAYFNIAVLRLGGRRTGTSSEAEQAQHGSHGNCLTKGSDRFTRHWVNVL
ncbi:hypothetical protein D9M68_954850 [compost metagenome]